VNRGACKTHKTRVPDGKRRHGSNSTPCQHCTDDTAQHPPSRRPLSAAGRSGDPPLAAGQTARACANKGCVVFARHTTHTHARAHAHAPHDGRVRFVPDANPHARGRQQAATQHTAPRSVCLLTLPGHCRAAGCAMRALWGLPPHACQHQRLHAAAPAAAERCCCHGCCGGCCWPARVLLHAWRCALPLLEGLQGGKPRAADGWGVSPPQTRRGRCARCGASWLLLLLVAGCGVRRRAWAAVRGPAGAHAWLWRARLCSKTSARGRS
jgi:hypothetical protein